MTNVQYYISIGVPMFTVLVVWLGTTLLNRGAIESLGISIRAEMKMGFDAVNQRIDRLETKLDRIDHEIRVDHEHRLTILEERLLAKTG